MTKVLLKNLRIIMKTKLVIWGANEKDERVLIALKLNTESNSVDSWAFPESVVTDAFEEQMMNEWRNGKEVELPEPNEKFTKDLSASESMLPDSLKVEKSDILQRAQTEWHFIVLSAKLHQTYQTELEELQKRVEGLAKYEKGVWDNLKEFWAKVQDQVRDKNLFRDHANSLRDNTNALFGKMKELRSKLDEEFTQKSKSTMESFMGTLDDIESRIKEGSRLQAVFNDLKGLQRSFRDSKLVKEHRSKVWARLDAAFKEVKEKRFGAEANQDSTPLDRLNRRYQGLMKALEKMERSIKRDEDELAFQERRIARTEGQLEAQIRQAKIKMIEERIRSKREKLGEMQTTQSELEKKKSILEEKDRQRQEREKVKQAEVAAKEKIAAQIEEQQKSLADQSDDLEKAAAAMTPPADAKQEEPAVEEAKAEEPQESTIEQITTNLTETAEDVVDTVKAVASVVAGKISEKVAEIREEIQEEVEEIKEEVQEEVAEIKAKLQGEADATDAKNEEE